MVFSSVTDATILKLRPSPVTTSRLRGPEQARSPACAATVGLQSSGAPVPMHERVGFLLSHALGVYTCVCVAGVWEQQ